ncbi:hypothetical protein ACSLOE_30770, partial [Escherichia coli]
SIAFEFNGSFFLFIKRTIQDSITALQICQKNTPPASSSSTPFNQGNLKTNPFMRKRMINMIKGMLFAFLAAFSWGAAIVMS